MADCGPMICESHRARQEAEGPPCTLTMRGYVFPGEYLTGNINQPCSRRFPFVQWKFTISPHAGLTPALSIVSCFQFPIGPAQSSAGVLADCRMTADTDPSRESAPFKEDC